MNFQGLGLLLRRASRFWKQRYVTSTPGGTAQAERTTTAQRSTRMCADWHAETMAWTDGPSVYDTRQSTGLTRTGAYRWYPQLLVRSACANSRRVASLSVRWSARVCSTHRRHVLRKYLPRKTCAIISDSNVAPLFADRVKKSLTSADFRPTLITIPAGEKSKTLEQAGAICDQMIAAGLDRQSFVVGLGGGMIGDISGFVAAIYHRGIPHVQIPTTLLAMVDSSIGGKTGVNTRAWKKFNRRIPSALARD